MELTAICEALETPGCGPVKNRDFWERLFGLVWDERRDVTFEWIKGHAGDPNNNRVDRLARAAALSAG